MRFIETSLADAVDGVSVADDSLLCSVAALADDAVSLLLLHPVNAIIIDSTKIEMAEVKDFIITCVFSVGPVVAWPSPPIVSENQISSSAFSLPLASSSKSSHRQQTDVLQIVDQKW